MCLTVLTTTRMTTMSDPDQAIDWQGQTFDCAGCPDDAKPAGRCALMEACVRDRYAKRIERFFSWNPELANDYLDHPYFEVRACAARKADVFHLRALIDDPDETVRWVAASQEEGGSSSAARHRSMMSARSGSRTKSSCTPESSPRRSATS